MSRLRRLLATGLAGAMLGVVLAVAAPAAPTAASASASLDDCQCWDYGYGSYRCNYGHDSCLSGSEKCDIDCN